MYTCASCGKKACDAGDPAAFPGNCPSRETDLEAAILAMYDDPGERAIAVASAQVEAEGYCRKTRIEETIDFAKKCQYKRIGIAFCVGFSKEASILAKILRYHGFTVESVVCKNGSIPKESLGLVDEDKIHPGEFEPMCNPIGQAVLLAKAATDFNIVLGLCVGHDSLFLRHSEAPVTVLAVKDRVLAHNPLGALYLSEGYYKSKLYP